MVVIRSISDMEKQSPMSSEERLESQVLFSPDMFFSARSLLERHPWVVACDPDGNEKCALSWQYSSYLHLYQQTGTPDLLLLNRYECLILYGCNEYSVALCRYALGAWAGKRLVCIGWGWNELLLQIPEIRQFECFVIEDFPGGKVMSDELLQEVSGGLASLQILSGLSIQEDTTRLKENILYYDEVLPLVFLFSDRRSFGEEHADQRFFLVDGGYEVLGLFALIDKATAVARYAKSRGYTPIIRITQAANSIYSDGSGDDIWGKFFNQPEDYSLSDISKCKEVCVSPPWYNGSVVTALMDQIAGNTQLSWPSGRYNDRLTTYIRERERRFLPEPERTLGVLARGTDYITARPAHHAKHADKEMIADKIRELLQLWDLKYIFLATEDADYCQFFREQFGDLVYYTDQERYTTQEGEKLFHMHRRLGHQREGFYPGAEYALAIRLLSECNSLLASGACSGYGEALRENAGRYAHTFCFDLGVW